MTQKQLVKKFISDNEKQIKKFKDWLVKITSSVHEFDRLETSEENMIYTPFKLKDFKLPKREEDRDDLAHEHFYEHGSLIFGIRVEVRDDALMIFKNGIIELLYAKFDSKCQKELDKAYKKAHKKIYGEKK